MSDFLFGLVILVPGVGLGAAIAYLTAGKPVVGPGTRIRRPRITLRRQ
ncbi:hypothetical protein [Streptomyces sp. AK02-04a]|nr:hypothetical protein [Streptomyces sp. AK02-04a]MDX3759326.1 hypothetical protein [Streptomyces sp. AK02-04a]